MRAGNPTGGHDNRESSSRFERIIGSLLVLCVIILAAQFGLWTYRRVRPPVPLPDHAHAGLELGGQFPVVESLDQEGNSVVVQPAEGETPATLLVLLTTTCPFCRVNVPVWNEIHQALGEQVRFIGLSLDDREKTRRFAEISHARFPLFAVKDMRSLVTELGIQAVPQTLVLDAEGVVRGIWVGGLSDEKDALILGALGEIVPGLRAGPSEGKDPGGK